MISSFRTALLIASAAAAGGTVFKWLETQAAEGIGAPWLHVILRGTVVEHGLYNSLCFFVGMLVSFRTSHALGRYVDGCGLVYRMIGEWMDAVSVTFAFCRGARASDDQVLEFQHSLVRLVSVLNAMILAELEKKSDGEVQHAFTYDLLDAQGIDSKAMRELYTTELERVDLVFQWIQNIIIDGTISGVVAAPPPLVSRAFQALEGGMMHFRDALKYSDTPFPFPYAATMEILCVVYTVVTPVSLRGWTSSSWCAGCYAFILVFVLWSMHLIAGELENPFEQDVNDLNMDEVQSQLNDVLLTLISPIARHSPGLSVRPKAAMRRLHAQKGKRSGLGLRPEHQRSYYRVLHRGTQNPHALVEGRSTSSSVSESLFGGGGTRSSLNSTPSGRTTQGSRRSQRTSRGFSFLSTVSFLGQPGEAAATADEAPEDPQLRNKAGRSSLFRSSMRGSKKSRNSAVRFQVDVEEQEIDAAADPTSVVDPPLEMLEGEEEHVSRLQLRSEGDRAFPVVPDELLDSDEVEGIYSDGEWQLASGPDLASAVPVDLSPQVLERDDPDGESPKRAMRLLGQPAASWASYAEWPEAQDAVEDEFSQDGAAAADSLWPREAARDRTVPPSLRPGPDLQSARVAASPAAPAIESAIGSIFPVCTSTV